VVFGEIGGSQEEELAELITSGRITKPVAAYIGGKAAKAGTRFKPRGRDHRGESGDTCGEGGGAAGGRAVVCRCVWRVAGGGGFNLARTRKQVSYERCGRKAVWTTAITKIEPNKVAVRGHDIATLMGKISFGAAVYLILTGKLPDERVGRLMDAILVSSIDHGATPPSCLAARLWPARGRV